MASRRQFVSNALGAALSLPAPHKQAPPNPASPTPTEITSLNGEWSFRTDPGVVGEVQNWQNAPAASAAWSVVVVPHTWQIEAPLASYRGFAWYRKTFDAPRDLDAKTVRLEFEAVFHTARVWVNGKLAGEHARKGYTAFTFDITTLLIRDAVNTLAVRVDNNFNDHMLPRGHSSDWAHDGGIYRPVQLLITPPVFVDRIDVDALPDGGGNSASLDITAFVQNRSGAERSVNLSFRVIDDAIGLTVLSGDFAGSTTVAPNSQVEASASATLSQPKLWHFDSPHLYRLEVTAQSDRHSHTHSTTFGIRRFEVRGTAFYLNGEKVRLMGVERMAGSHPEHGMAEPDEWIEHDHQDLKYLNCVFTRVHWPQDKRVLDYCDGHGILIQTEVPTWGTGYVRVHGRAARRRHYAERYRTIARDGSA
jgi:beta-galactosidase